MEVTLKLHAYSLIIQHAANVLFFSYTYGCFFLLIKSLQFDKEQMASLAEANQALKQQVEQMQEEAKK